MTAITVRNFLGEVPVASSQMLPDGCAVSAVNTKLLHGNLQAWNAPSSVATLTKPGVKKTLYRFGESDPTDAQYWFSWTTDVDCVRAPIHGDTTERTYFTGDGYPKKTDAALAQSGGTNYPMNAYKLGIPSPNTATVSAVVSGTPTDVKDAPINAAYVITYVSGWGEEGAPGDDAIGPVVFKPGQSVTLSNLPTAPSGNYNITAKRIYRSNTGSASSAYQFCDEIPVSQLTYVDTRSSNQLGELLETRDWYEPPDTAFGLTLGANGNAILLDDKTICPCVPNVLYAYPEAYRLTTESTIVGAGAFSQGFAILTKANPYVIIGVDPASYTMTRLDNNQACVSKRSIVEMNGGVVYASPDGLWGIDNSGMRSLTGNLLSQQDWQAYNPSSIHAYELDGRYYAFYDTGVKQGCLIFDFGRVPYLIETDQYCTAAYNDPLRDALYMVRGSSVDKWDAGAPLTYKWRSKDYRFGWYKSMGYARVEARSYPLTLRVFYDGVLGHTQTVTSAKPFRLPAKTATVYSFELEGTVTVDGITLAEGSGELYA